MKLDERFDFYKEMYYFELSRRDRIVTGTLRLPFAFVVLLSGGALYLARSWPTGSGVAVLLFTLTFWCGVGLLLVASTYLIRAWVGHTYWHVATAKEWEDWYVEYERYERDLEAYRKEYPGAPTSSFTMKSAIASQFASYGHSNKIANDRKSGLAHIAKNMLIWAVILLTVAAASHVASELGPAAGERQVEQ